MEIYKTIILAIAAYLVGSISPSYIITKKLTGKDIRNIDVKNAGTLNVFLNVGAWQGIIVGVFDCLKTLIIVLAGQAWGLDAVHTIAAASFGIIGHCFPVYHNFYGGKGVASVMGIFIYFIPLELLISIILSVLIGFIIGKLGITPVFFIALSPLIAALRNQPTSLVFALVYIAFLIGIINLIIILTKRDKKTICDCQRKV